MRNVYPNIPNRPNLVSLRLYINENILDNNLLNIYFVLKLCSVDYKFIK